MTEEVESQKKFIRWFFFLAGIIATLAYRIIIVLNFYSPYWVKVSWYVGTVGFIVYFGHRAYIQKKRSNLVKDNNLIKIVSGIKNADKKQRVALNYIIRTSMTSKARWNSLFIFWLSILALVVGIVLDLGLINF